MSQIMDENEFLKRKQLLATSHLSQSLQCDKAILTLGSAGFGISLVFIKDIATNPSALSIVVLALGWLCLLGSITAVLVSFRFSIEAHRLEDEVLELLKVGSNELPENKWNARILYLGWGALIFLVAGVLLVAVFAILNLTVQEGDEMSNENKPQPTNLPEGALPPTRPSQLTEHGAVTPARPATQLAPEQGQLTPARPVTPPPPPKKD